LKFNIKPRFTFKEQQLCFTAVNAIFAIGFLKLLTRAREIYSDFLQQKKSSHRIYKTPWQGDPRINIQNHKGKAKAYQVKQVLLAIEKLEVSHGRKK